MKRIAIFGFGGVGQALVKIIRTGKLPIDIRMVIDRSYLKKQSSLGGIPASDDIGFVKKLEQIDLVVELMGGVSTPLFIIREALDSRIPVVTANKAVLAEHGYSLFMKSQKNQTPIFFEAAVAGAIPIVRNIQEIFSYEKIQKAVSILNGTTNYILSKMRMAQKEQAMVLREAQKLGFAESDPGLDMNGVDASQKLALLSGLIQKKWVDYHKIYTRGIEEISLSDILFAGRMKYQIKLISGFQNTEKGILVSTEPMLIKKEHPLWGIELENNAVCFTGNHSGEHLFIGKGAGPFPTAYSVLSDILCISKSHKGMKLSEDYQTIRNIENIETPVYIRIPVEDEVGVLEKISGILSANQISIASLIQNESAAIEKADGQRTRTLSTSLLDQQSKTEIVILTHKCSRENLFKAIHSIQKEKTITNRLVYMGVQ